MNAIGISLIVFACLLGASFVGMRIRDALPGHHLNDDSKHLLEIGLGIIGTMAGLVLGLLVSSATASYNAQRNEVLDVSSKVVVFDRMLKRYGPEALPARRSLHAAVERALYRIWPNDSARVRLDPSAGGSAILFDETEALSAKNDVQRSLKPEMMALLMNVSQTRWLMFEQASSSVSYPLLTMLVFWFTITFAGFGIFAPRNATVISALALCSLAVSGAVFLILEMYAPFEGLVQIPSDSLRDALAHLGR